MTLADRLKSAALDTVNAVGPLRRFLGRRLINRYAYAGSPRPRPISMAADYATWTGFIERRYSGRHLPPAEGARAPLHPDRDRVAELFRRTRFVPATDTSALFPLFAQWFVDGFLRTKWEETEPRTFRENESNHEIDLNQIYGMDEARTAMLREHGSGDRRGRLRTREIGGEVWPAPLFEERDGAVALAPCYAATDDGPGLYTQANFDRVYGSWTDEEKRFAFAVGLEHGNATLGQSAMNALFVREHNRTAGLLAAENPGWDDERVFQTARNVTIAVLLHIVVSDYIVHIAPVALRFEAIPGMAERERWYRTNRIAVEFALLYRWHDLIPDEIVVDGAPWPAPSFRRPNERLVATGLDAVLAGAARAPAGRIGLHNTAPFLLDRHEDDGADVKRLSLDMGRACRLASFNDYRRHFGLSTYASFEDLTRDRATAAELKALYGDVDRLEWFVGLFAEGYGEASMMGELMVTMVANDAFTQALTNPLLAAGVYNAGTFGRAGMEIVNTTRRLSQVIVRNTGLTDESVLRFERTGAAVPT